MQYGHFFRHRLELLCTYVNCYSIVYTSGISSRQVRSTGIREHKVVSEMRTSLALGAFYIELHVVRASVLQISVMNVKSHCDLRMIPKR